MAKRSARYKARDFQESENVHPFPSRGGWNPRGEDDVRDRKYVKNIRAMSTTQQVLLDAIEERSVVLALGPAGTGKTYLAIAKAVEALEAGRCGASCCRVPRWRRARISASFPATSTKARALSAPALRRLDRASRHQAPSRPCSPTA